MRILTSPCFDLLNRIETRLAFPEDALLLRPNPGASWLLFGPFGKCDRESLRVCEEANALHGITSHLDGDNA